MYIIIDVSNPHNCENIKDENGDQMTFPTHSQANSFAVENIQCPLIIEV
ncbi:MAG: hypothetical protein ACOC22_01935 [bacterium]